MMDAAIYIRVSTLDQAREGYSLAAQEYTLRRWCDQNGHNVVAVYADEGISAKDIHHRPAMQQLLLDVKQHKFDMVLVWALSRFTRSVSDLYNCLSIGGVCAARTGTHSRESTGSDGRTCSTRYANLLLRIGI